MIQFFVFLNFIKKITPILIEIINMGGMPYLVGGGIRDLFMNRDVKDIDIEVHKMSLKNLENCLNKFGKVKKIGKKFGVLRLNKIDVDWSLPRKDTKGRKPKVEIDSNMNIKQACKRRDLTMNAMALDLTEILNLENNKYKAKNFDWRKNIRIIDPYGGLKDIKNKKLKVVDEKLFIEDPLRFFRVMQFIGRFEMTPDKKLNDLCKRMKLYDINSMTPISKERIFEEIKKLMLKSVKPSLGFRWLYKIGRLKEIFPELYALIGVRQKKIYHPEGDVFEHTMQALDAAAVLNKYENNEEKFIIMLAALCHDLGKAVTTDKNLSCKGHAKAGVSLTKKMLKRITNDKLIIESVSKLVLYHTAPADLLKQKSGIKAYKRLAAKLSPQVTMRQAAILTLADIRGRNPNSSIPLSNASNLFGNDEELYNLFLQKVKEANIEHGAEKPILLGRHLLDVVKPGQKMGKILKKAYEIQIEKGITDWKELKKIVLKKR